MALKLDDVKLKPSGALKSLLDLILERKDNAGSKTRKKRVLRPWESFSDSKQGRNFDVARKKRSIMKPFVKECQLSDEQKMALRVKKRAKELFSNVKK